VTRTGLFARGLALLGTLVGCSQPTPRDAEVAREGAQQRAAEQPDSVPDLVQSRVPQARAGDSLWKYQQSVTADVDGDGKDETVTLLSDVRLDARGIPMWEDGHRWQVYVDDGGEITRLYARFLPNGKLTAEIATPVGGNRPTILLLEQMPDRLGVYEFLYRGPNQVDVWQRVSRELDRSHQFTGSPRP
jgi:hypothetical protein